MTIQRRLTLIWAAMIALTLLSYGASERFVGHATLAIVLVIGLAMVKVRFVILDFMEVRHAPIALRALLEAWTIWLAGMLIFLLA